MINFVNNTANFFKSLQRLSIYHKIAIGNSLIIIFGAIFGTIITHNLTDQAVELPLILFFSTIGILISVTINIFILRSALIPLWQLQKSVDRLSDNTFELDTNIKIGGADIQKFAETLKNLIHELDKRNLQLETLSKEIINAHEEERNRIARSLHDDTGQSLSSLIIFLDDLTQQSTSLNSNFQKKILASNELAKNTLNELRKIIFDLRPPILDDLGLPAAIRNYAKESLVKAGIRTKFILPEKIDHLPSELSINLYRIAQEAINNIMRHSKAQNACIALRVSNDLICLSIEDNGQGFDVQDILKSSLKSQHWGLVGIRERTEILNGQFNITSSRQSGTKIIVQAPFRNNKFQS